MRIAVRALAAFLTATFAASACFAQAGVIINEMDADTPSTDMLEFVELLGTPGGSLTGLVLVFYNGATDVSYRAIDLDGFTFDANGLFLAGNAGVSPAPAVTWPNDTLQNGQDAVALYTANATDFPLNTPVTTTNLVDAVVYDTSDLDDPQLLVLLNPAQPQVDENGTATSATVSIGRCPNGSGGARNTSTYAVMAPTPGAANTCAIAVEPATWSKTKHLYK